MAEQEELLDAVEAIQMSIWHTKETITLDLINKRAAAFFEIHKRGEFLPFVKDITEDEKLYIIEELIRRSKERIGKPSCISNKDGEHVEWLNSARKKDWKYWNRYKSYLKKNLSPTIMESIDETTDLALEKIEDPKRLDSSWDSRGMVVGQVQSGKTANYTGLICKAADAGYKIIIVLSGMTNSLRVQTQIRLEECFLGYSTKDDDNAKKPIGVGDIDPTIETNYCTTRKEKGDFKKNSSLCNGITPENRPTLFVVKKNARILKNLKDWLTTHLGELFENKQRKITKYPLLIIDDEADNASVDTGEQPFDSEGNPDPDYDPKTINKLIRQILVLFTHTSYIGYTATPFANIFIHEQGETEKEGLDLFPKDFIVNLPIPNNYYGPEKFFGNDGHQTSLDLIEIVDDNTKWLSPKHKNGTVPTNIGKYGIPESLQRAILSFLISSTIRCFRGDQCKHSSMLIHVTRFVKVQAHVYEQVELYLKKIKQRLSTHIDDDDIICLLRALYESPQNGYLDNAKKFVLEEGGDEEKYKMPSFEDMLDKLKEIIFDVKIKQINGSVGDILDYESHKKIGLKVIAIGGDKLARGLTLEGLCVSYFVRNSSMYDSLMQMGRWFGFRKGYEDLCRLFISEDLNKAFAAITEALTELREEFDFAVDHGIKPIDYGLRVLKKEALFITSPLKMRHTKEISYSFNGQLKQTIVFFKDQKKLQDNINAVDNLLGQLGEENAEFPINTVRNGVLKAENSYRWKGVNYKKICSFLKEYTTPQKAFKVNSIILADYIEKMAMKKQLTDWDVILKVTKKGAPVVLKNFSHATSEKHSISKKVLNQDPKYVSVGVISSSSFESLDLTEQEWNYALERSIKNWEKNGRSSEKPKDPRGEDIRYVRGMGYDGKGHPERGVLVLSFLNPIFFPDYVGMSESLPIAAFFISFPLTSNSEELVYQGNNVLLENLENIYEY